MLDQVSEAVGHSSPVVTKRFYDHFVRRSFSASLRTGLGLGAKHTVGGDGVELTRELRQLGSGGEQGARSATTLFFDPPAAPPTETVCTIAPSST